MSSHLSLDWRHVCLMLWLTLHTLWPEMQNPVWIISCFLFLSPVVMQTIFLLSLMVVLTCCIQSMPVAINTHSPYFLLSPSAFFTWYKALPSSKIIIVCTLFFLRENLSLFCIIADLNHIHHVTCLFNVLQFISSSFEIISSSSLLQQSIQSLKLIHKIALSRMACTEGYIKASIQVSGPHKNWTGFFLGYDFPLMVLLWKCTFYTSNIIAIHVISLEAVLIARLKYLRWALCLVLFIECIKVLLVNNFFTAFAP